MDTDQIDDATLIAALEAESHGVCDANALTAIDLYTTGPLVGRCRACLGTAAQHHAKRAAARLRELTRATS